MTTIKPENISELQLYRVLERANLLQYYITFINQGGDDVQQFCEAGEEEFLEIMALVGMATKPLHVRRLQKALQEWVQNPDHFKRPLGVAATMAPPTPPKSSIIASVNRQPARPSPPKHPPPVPTLPPDIVDSGAHATCPTQDWLQQQITEALKHTTTPPPCPEPSSECDGESDAGSTRICRENNNSSSVSSTPIPVLTACIKTEIPERDTDSPPQLTIACSELTNMDSGQPSPLDIKPDLTCSSLTNPLLSVQQTDSLAQAAYQLSTTLPEYQPRPLSMKKPESQAVEALLKMEDDNPSRMELMRIYGAIYGRFDSKRKNEKGMSLHEVRYKMCVNEAAAQLCRLRPTLLTRRNDLYPLARMVVKNSGYQYSKGHSRAQVLDIPPNKSKRKSEGDHTNGNRKMSPELTEINEQLSALVSQQKALRSALEEAREAEDEVLLTSLQTRLDAVTTREQQLLTEQSTLMAALKPNKKRRRKSGISPLKNLEKALCNGDSNLSSEPSSPREVRIQLRYALSQASKDVEHLQDTLLDEGLRIAEQYGMADFAQELSDLKQDGGADHDKDNVYSACTSEADSREGNQREEEGDEERREETGGEVEEEDEDEEDEQEAWSREVEADAHRMAEGDTALPADDQNH